MALTQGEKIDAILESTSRIEARCNSCSKQVCRHELDLHGIPGDTENPGVLTRTTVNEHELLHIRRKYQKMTAGAWALVVAMLVATGTFIANLWRKG